MAGASMRDGAGLGMLSGLMHPCAPLSTPQPQHHSGTLYCMLSAHAAVLSRHCGTDDAGGNRRWASALHKGSGRPRSARHGSLCSLWCGGLCQVCICNLAGPGLAGLYGPVVTTSDSDYESTHALRSEDHGSIPCTTFLFAFGPPDFRPPFCTLASGSRCAVSAPLLDSCGPAGGLGRCPACCEVCWSAVEGLADGAICDPVGTGSRE